MFYKNVIKEIFYWFQSIKLLNWDLQGKKMLSYAYAYTQQIMLNLKKKNN